MSVERRLQREIKDSKICDLVESKMKETIITINRTYSITEADKLHSELRILDRIFHQAGSVKNKLLNVVVPRSWSL